MGVGKTTLTKLIHERFGWKTFYEPEVKNPYLQDFYQNMKRWAFRSQLYFLSNKFRLHQELDRTSGVVVLDRTIFEDAEVFATALREMRKIDERDWATPLVVTRSCRVARLTALMIAMIEPSIRLGETPRPR